eukprot:scaffold18328_cov37-Phaeocystis_antarctica.AAC.3
MDGSREARLAGVGRTESSGYGFIARCGRVGRPLLRLFLPEGGSRDRPFGTVNFAPHPSVSWLLVAGRRGGATALQLPSEVMNRRKLTHEMRVDTPMKQPAARAR